MYCFALKVQQFNLFQKIQIQCIMQSDNKVFATSFLEIPEAAKRL